MRVVGRSRRQLLDPARCEGREILLCPLQRGEGGARRLVGEGDGDVRAAGQRLQQPPLRPRQVLEAVGEDRAPVPGLELGLEPLDRVAAEQVGVPEAERIELGPVGGVQPREVAVQVVGVEQPRLELDERRSERVGEPAEARGAAEPVQ
jgi:hypothetical protein